MHDGLPLPRRAPHHFGFFLVPKFSMMAFSSAVEPLRVANRFGGGDLYRWSILSSDGQPVQASNGMLLIAEGSLLGTHEYSTLVVCAGFDPERHFNARIRSRLRQLDRYGVDLGAIDTGSFLLARCGLLDGYRTTVHWEALESFQERFPKVHVGPYLFEIDRNRLTCAGGTAALDMMLHIIQLEHGYRLSTAVAEQFIHGAIRDAHDLQRMDPGKRHGVTHPKLARVIAIMERNLEEPLSARSLADTAHLSLRQLERLFDHHFQRTPRRYYQELRLQRARTLLQYTGLSIIEVAIACGFTSPAHFSRAYHGWAGRPPREERRRLGINTPLY